MSQHDLFGVPSSKLDGYKQVSTVPDGVCRCKKKNCPLTHYQNEDGTDGPWQCPIPTEPETAFRHSGWATDRQRVLSALSDASVNSRRIERFKACGAAAYVEFNKETQRYRVRGFFCGDRFCVPCSRARAARGRRSVLALAKGRVMRFLTLTRKSQDESLTDALDHLLRSFRKVRADDRWKDQITGGVGVVEVKRGALSGHWHVHLHLLVLGGYLDKHSLKAAWLKATGDSYILKIKAIRDEQRGVGYVCKYLGKGFDQSVIRHPEDLAECISALSGRRLLIPFGEWFGKCGDIDVEASAGWSMVGGLHSLFFQAARGDEFANSVFLALSRQRGGVDEAPPPGLDDDDV